MTDDKLVGKDIAHLTKGLLDDQPGMVYRCPNDPDRSGEDITERRAAEIALKHQQHLVSLNLRVAQAFLTCDDTDIHREVTEIILAELDAESGGFGAPDEAGDLVCRWLDGTSGGKRRVPSEPQILPLAAPNDPLARAARENKTFLSNEPVRCSAWDVVCKNVIAAPIHQGTDLLGLLVVANCAGGLGTAERELLESVARQMAPVIDARNHAERLRRERERLEKDARQSSKLEAIGSLAGGVAHDFNNLLTVINTSAGFALQSLREGDPIREDIASILEAGERAARLTRQLLAFGRQQILKPETLNLTDVVVSMENLIRRLLGEHVELRLALQPDLGSVEADRAQIEQALITLVINGREAMSDGGTLIVETSRFDAGPSYVASHGEAVPGPYICLAVRDTGAGIAQEIRERIFEPFYSTKDRSEGAGLGLAAVHGVVSQSEGHMTVDSEPGAGTVFRVCLPQVSVPRGSEVSDKSPSATQGNELIVLVDDEEAVRNVARRVLVKAGYEVVAVANGAEALVACKKHHDRVALVITDVVMPMMSGRELAERLAESSPELRVVYMSGYAGATGEHAALGEEIRLVHKPFRASELLEVVRGVLDEH